MKFLKNQISTKAFIILLVFGLVFGLVLAFLASKKNNYGNKAVPGVQYYFPEDLSTFPKNSKSDQFPKTYPEDNFKKSKTSEFCAQVITPAINIKTREVREFPTPCDVPEGWERVAE